MRAGGGEAFVCVLLEVRKHGRPKKTHVVDDEQWSIGVSFG